MATSMRLIVSVTLTILCAAMTAVSAAPAQGAIPQDCSAVLPSVMPCLVFVQVGSKQPDPGKICCTGVGTVMTNTPQCLCTIITNAPSFKPPIDMDRLLDLPHLCSINIPVPDCDDSKSPKPSPGASSPDQPPSSLPPSAPKANQNSTSGAAERCGRTVAIAGVAATVFFSAFMS